MDNLEKYIQENRQEFDRQVPAETVWNNIASELPCPKVQKKKPLFRKFAAAASVLLLVGFSYFAGLFSAPQEEENLPAVAELETIYKSRIDAKVKAVATSTPDTLWKDDLFQLEAVLQELKHELSTNPISTREEILEAMKQNYQIRLELLNRILERTGKTYRNTKPTDHERTE